MVDNAITHYSCCLSFLVFLFALSNEVVNRKKKTHHNLNAHYSSFCKNGWRWRPTQSFCSKQKKVEQTFSPFSSKSNCKQNTKTSENVHIVSLFFFSRAPFTRFIVPRKAQLDKARKKEGSERENINCKTKRLLAVETKRQKKKKNVDLNVHWKEKGDWKKHAEESAIRGRDFEIQST